MSTQPIVPSAGTEKPTIPAAPSPSATVDNSEAAILERAAQGQHSAEEPSILGEPQAPGTEKPATEPAKEPEKEVEEPQGEEQLETAPEGHDDFAKWKPLFAQLKQDKEHPELASELRQIIGRHAAFTEQFPNFSEAKQLREWFPTMEDAERIVEDASQVRKFGETYRSDPAGFVETLKDLDANAFNNLATQFPTLLYQANPQLFIQQAQATIVSTMENVFEAAQREGNDALVEAIQLVARDAMNIRLGMQPRQTDRPDPRDAELQRYKQKDKEREEAERTQGFETFAKGVETEWINTTVEKIATKISDLLPDTNAFQRELLVKESWASLQTKLKAQPHTMSQKEAFLTAAERGKVGIAEHKAFLDFLVKRADATFPSTVKEVVDRYTKGKVTANRKEIEGQKADAERTKEPAKGGGVPAANPITPAAPQRRRSEDEVFAAVEAGTYTPR